MRRGLILVGLLFVTAVTWAQVAEHTAPVDDYYFGIHEYSLTKKGLKEDGLAFIKYLEKHFEFIKEVNLPRAFKDRCYAILWDKYSYMDLTKGLNSSGGYGYLYPGIYCVWIHHKYSGTWEQYAIFIIINNKSEVEVEMCWLIQTIGS